MKKHHKLAPYKKTLAHSYSFGVCPTIEMLTHKPDNVLKVLLNARSDANSGVQKIKKLCSQKDIYIEYNDNLIARLAKTENTYAIGVFKKYIGTVAPQKNHVLLVNPSDAGNLGTIARTMLGFNVENLAIIRPGVDVFDPKCVRSSMGSIFQLNFEYFSTFDEYLRACGGDAAGDSAVAEAVGRNFYVFRSDAKVMFGDVTFKTPYTLVFGNEGAGFDARYSSVGTGVKIAQSSKVDSLNLAVSVGIGLYGVTY